MKTEAIEMFIRWCILGAIGGVLMAAGDWLLGCVPLQQTDAGMFSRVLSVRGLRPVAARPDRRAWSGRRLSLLLCGKSIERGH